MTEWQEVVFGQKGHLSRDEEKVSGCASRSSVGRVFKTDAKAQRHSVLGMFREAWAAHQ